MTSDRGVPRLLHAAERGVSVLLAWMQDYLPELMIFAFGILFAVVGALLVWAALLRRAENAASRASGEKPNWRKASPGCLIVVGVPLFILGAVILGFLWYALASSHIPPTGGMPA